MTRLARPAAMMALLVLAACQPAGSTPAATNASSRPGSLAQDPSGAASVPGSVASEAAGLPDGFPLPPGARELPIETGSALLGRWEVDDPGNEVYDFYVEQLPANGFTVHAVAPGDTVAIVRFTAPDGRQLQLDMTGTFTVRLELGPIHP
ncbi:MAG TPA: hypothetical protein VFH63_04395 [candidate division Zixibacteria bacterium]|nr:hypothetical protein [candidate division Zixibacteria bacterium]